MKLIKIFSFFILNGLIINNSIAQISIEWEKNFGGDQIENVFGHQIIQQTFDGGFIVAAQTQSSNSGDISRSNKGSIDFWVLKLDSLGNLLWENNYGGNGFDILYSIDQTSDRGFLLAGRSNSNASGDFSGNSKGNADFWIVKIDNLGNLVWEKNYGGSQSDFAYSISETTDKGFIVAGTTGSSNGDVSGLNNGNLDFWIVKLNSLGNLVWEKNYGGNRAEVAHSIQQTNDGGFIVAGIAQSSNGDISGTNNGGDDFWIMKLDSIGNLIWEKNYGGNSQDRAYSIQQISNGGFIIAGYSGSSANGDFSRINNGFDDFWIMNLDNLGNLVWENNYGGSRVDQAYTVQQSLDKGFIVTGYTSSDSSGDVSGINKGNFDIWTIKLDSTGNLIWEKNFGGNNLERAYSIIQTKDNGFIIAGETESSMNGDISGTSNGRTDIWIVKLSSETSSIFDNQNLELDLKIYPNPTKNQFTLEILDKKANGDLLIEITDTKGNLIQKQKLETKPFIQKEFDLSGFSSGVYFIKMQNKNGILTKRISLID